MSAVPPLSYQTPIVDPDSGKPSNFFIRLWQNIFVSKNLRVTADRSIIKYDGLGDPDPADQTTTFTASKSNSAAGVSWTMKDSNGNALVPGLYLSDITGDTVTMTRAQFESAINVNNTIGVRVIASLTDDGETYRDQATLTKVQDGVNGTSGANGADGADGYSVAEVSCFQRATSTPATPTGGSYDFATKVLTPPSGWTVVPPAGTDTLYMARGTVYVVGLTGTATPAWVGVGKIAQDGVSGTAGLTVELSNPAIALWAYADGTVLSYGTATGSVKVLSGTTDVSSLFSLSVVTNPQALTIGFVSQSYAITGGFDPGEDNASITIRISGSGAYSGVFFDKTIVLAKMKGGYEIVSSLPSTNLFAGRVVYLLSDNKLYRYTGSAWTTAVPALDITGQLADAQIAALAASKITGQLSDAQLAAIAAAKVTGQLTDSQLAAIAAAKVTGQITSTQIADNSISTPKLQAGSVTASVIAADTITAGQIAANAITTSELAAGAVTTAKIVAGAVTAGEIAAGAIVTSKIAAGAVTAAEIAAGAVVAGKIAANAVTANEIAANSIVAGKIATDAITTNNIQAGAVTAAKISVTQLSAITATIGTLRTAVSGARVEIKDNLIAGYHSNDALAFRLGVW